MRIYKRIAKLILVLAIILVPSLLLAQTGPNLNFKKLDGGTFNLSELRGRVVVISFSAKGIPLMRYEIPQLERLAAKFADRGVTVLWIGTNSARPKTGDYASDEDMRTIAGQYPHLTVLRDPERSACRQVGADSLPTIFIIDQKGKLVGQPHAGIDPQANLVNDLSHTIIRLLAE